MHVLASRRLPYAVLTKTSRLTRRRANIKSNIYLADTFVYETLKFRECVLCKEISAVGLAVLQCGSAIGVLQQ